MRRYPFERAPLQMMRSETVLIDQDGAEESSPAPATQSRVEYQQQPMAFRPPSPAPVMSPIAMPSPTRMDSLGPMTFQPSSAPRLDPALSKPASPIAALDPIQQARSPSAPQLEPQKLRQQSQFSPLEPARTTAVPPPQPLESLRYQESSPAPQVAPFEPRIAPKLGDMPQPERSAVEPPKSLPELKYEPKQAPQLTDEQINALFSGVRQAPRVSLLGIPATNKLFSEEYTNAERL